MSVTQAVSSAQATLRHTKESAYCCFLPDLTGFTGFRCAEPGRQHHLQGADLTETKPQEGIRSRYSGLRVQGTATSPLSTANLITLSGAFVSAFFIISFSTTECNNKFFHSFMDCLLFVTLCCLCLFAFFFF